MENEILVTKNYDKFVIINENRTVNQTHLKNLVSSIEHNNLLHNCPIIVNENYEIVDGQHRLMASKILKVPLYYIIKRGASIDEVITLNNCSRVWRPEDFLDSWAKRGNQTYIILQKIAQDNKVSVRTLLRIGHHVTTSKCSMNSFKKGLFKADSLQLIKIRQVTENIIAITRAADLSMQSALVYALLFSLKVPEFSVDKILEQLKKPYNEIKVQKNVRDYLREIERAYNYQKQEKHHIRLF